MEYNFEMCEPKQQMLQPHATVNDTAWITRLLISLNVHHLCTNFWAFLGLEVPDKKGGKKIGTRGFEPFVIAPFYLIYHSNYIAQKANVHHLCPNHPLIDGQ